MEEMELLEAMAAQLETRQKSNNEMHNTE